MTETLEELKDKLYNAFDKALLRADNTGLGSDARAQNLLAAGKLAEAIVKTEERLDARRESQGGYKPLQGKT